MLQEIVKTDACCHCGICIAACPQGSIELDENDYPQVGQSCNECGICYEICPRVEMPYSKIQAQLKEKNKIAQEEDLVGHYNQILSARSTNSEIFKRAYCGGMTTTFLTHLMDKGLIDGALLTDKVHDFSFCAHPKPTVARTVEEIIACAYTKPTINPLLSKLPVKGKSITVVGNSCHVEAIRKAQYLSEHGKVSRKKAKELVGNIEWVIGLTCFFSNNKKGVEIVLGEKNLKEEEVKKFFYSHGIPTVELFNGEKIAFQYSGDSKSLSLGCLLCYPSYTAKLSDITFGKTMTETWGWNDVISRSKKADEILKEMKKLGKMEIQPIVNGGDELLNGLLEAKVFSQDAFGYAHYLKTGNFQHDETTAGMLTRRDGGTIKGINRLRLIQAVRKNTFYEIVVNERKKTGIFTPRLT